MMISRVFTAAAIAGVLFGCRSEATVATIHLDHLTASQARALISPYLSKEGTLEYSQEVPDVITVRDRRENVRQAQAVMRRSDASPRSVSLHFQVIRATAAGGIDPALERIAGALQKLLRFDGYSLVAQTMVSGSERRAIEQNINVGALRLNLAVRINDIVGESGVDLQVDLRRPGAASVLATNVVVPMGQTVVLGSAYPGSDGEALILTVRGEPGPTRLGAASDHDEDHARADAVAEDIDIEAVAEAAAAAAADAHAAQTAVEAHGLAHRNARARAEALAEELANERLRSERKAEYDEMVERSRAKDASGLRKSWVPPAKARPNPTPPLSDEL